MKRAKRPRTSAFETDNKGRLLIVEEEEAGPEKTDRRDVLSSSVNENKQMVMVWIYSSWGKEWFWSTKASDKVNISPLGFSYAFCSTLISLALYVVYCVSVTLFSFHSGWS